MNPGGSELSVSVDAHGPSPERIEQVSTHVLHHREMRDLLGDAEHRILYFKLGADPSAKPDTPAFDRFEAQVYDYSNGRLLTATGPLEDPDRLAIATSVRQPIPSQEEFQAAVELLRKDSELGPGLTRGDLVPFAPMPPLLTRERADGRVQRLVAVGVTGAGFVRHRVVAVDLGAGEVHRHLPGMVQAFSDTCGPPAASCPPAGRAGWAWVSVSLGGAVLWRFLAVRPAASSGLNGSGIELRHVDYRGSRVLYQAHAPILNILYDPGGCGPSYRDWQNGESCFQAGGADVAPGFRLCSSPPVTILDSGADGGSFTGVAIHVQGTEVVLVSQMSAGWYRYVTEWRLDIDGTIRPRWGFSAVDNGCTCHPHTHHVYWRLDFDIQTPGDNRVDEYNNPPIFPPSHWHTKRFEVRRSRDLLRQRHWRVTSATTGNGYLVLPGPSDGAPDAYGVGDLWVLRWHPTEIDDGQGFTTVPGLSMEHLDRFLDGEPVDRQDIVLWYAAHFRHDAAHEAGERVGPELRPL